MKKDNPWLACLFSVMICGLGQFYNGHPLKGSVHFIIPMVLLHEGGVAFPTGVLISSLPEELRGVFLIVNWGWSIIEATRSAYKQRGRL